MTSLAKWCTWQYQLETYWTANKTGYQHTTWSDQRRRHGPPHPRSSDETSTHQSPPWTSIHCTTKAFLRQHRIHRRQNGPLLKTQNRRQETTRCADKVLFQNFRCKCSGATEHWSNPKRNVNHGRQIHFWRSGAATCGTGGSRVFFQWRYRIWRPVFSAVVLRVIVPKL